MVELLSPVGDFECLKAAVQNGANAVYFGANMFSARAFATNFGDDELEKAINYAKLRGVKTNLTLNTLIRNDEFEEAINVAKKAYEYGIDAIIIQDLGLATKLLEYFPDINLHASTQMTVTNLNGVKELEKLGFKRVVLAREASLEEIKNICQNSNMEIEVFIHGALCVSYSGQCLFSSMVGGRSGNRGKCAQPCRLPYSLIDENGKTLDKGYLLSPRDLCTLEYLPDLIKAGVSSFKIEGRMKSPTYVATVTRIYRKYIDLAKDFLEGKISKFVIQESDKQTLLQVFNRGNFSSGYLSNLPNREFVFKEKPNNMGIYLGKIIKYNPSKGLVTVKLENPVSIGDTVSFEHEDSKYKISELMDKKTNIKSGQVSQIVTFGRMKGNIKLNDKIYKMADKALTLEATNSYSKENIKVSLSCIASFHKEKKIVVEVKSLSSNFSSNVSFEYDYVPEIAQNAPLSEESIIKQFNKTLDTCFEFKELKIDMDNDIFIPTSILNDIRRTAISKIEEEILLSFKKQPKPISLTPYDISVSKPDNHNFEKAICFNELNLSYDYSTLKEIDKIYIPFKYFCNTEFEEIIKSLAKKGKIYIYLPNIIKNSFVDVVNNKLSEIFSKFKIDGIVASNLSELDIIKQFKNLPIVANYTFNIFNSYTAEKLHDFGCSLVTLSPEQDANWAENPIYDSELIVYGKIPLMHTNYCPLGKSNKCYKDCQKLCHSAHKFYLKDRYNFTFRLIPDNFQTIATIYNSRNINVDYSNLHVKSIRFDILDETIDEINKIID